MELGFFTQPIHMYGRSYAETLEEDRDTFILADQLGEPASVGGQYRHAGGKRLQHRIRTRLLPARGRQHDRCASA